MYSKLADFIDLRQCCINYGGILPVKAEYFFSPQDEGGDDARDSDADPVTGQTTTFDIIWGEEVVDILTVGPQYHPAMIRPGGFYFSAAD